MLNKYDAISAIEEEQQNITTASTNIAATFAVDQRRSLAKPDPKT